MTRSARKTAARKAVIAVTEEGQKGCTKDEAEEGCKKVEEGNWWKNSRKEESGQGYQEKEHEKIETLT